MSAALAERRSGALVGLAVGDAAGWPARQHRSLLLPAWTRRIRRELDTFAEDAEVTTLPVPFALNQPTAPLHLGPADDTDWVVWTAQWLLALGPHPTRDCVHQQWRAAAREGTLPRGRISVATAADALVRGREIPLTGQHNPHHFDDAAAVRAVTFGVYASSPERAAELAGWDAEVTNAEDGVHAAKAVAALVAACVGGTELDAALDLAQAYLPELSLIGRNVGRAREIGRTASGPMDAAALLDDHLDVVYSYGVAAAETVAVACAMAATALRTGVGPAEAIAAAACLPRLADSAPALTGAVIGAARGLAALPAAWVDRCRTSSGCCRPDLAGIDLIDLAARLPTVVEPATPSSGEFAS
ncbi:ADP-ribosylglycohydrolase family protein [Actinopolymorpha alba]|uniref:ADP-ribosylglycohydrolase family protein n=1 Tax=Actinopolymorpha alba TaxID=533267 RepID=UPI000366DCE5|nr:ADP-ribosylglycohydrolase family protein [Actinopolymorpha alba]